MNTVNKDAEVLTISHGGNYVVNINAADGLQFQDDKIEIKPVDTFDILGKSGGGSYSIVHLDNTPGVGSEVLTVKANTINVAGSAKVVLRNKDHTLPLVTLDTTSKQSERIDATTNLYLYNNGQSIVTSIAIASNVATCVHDGQIAALTTGDRIRITDNNGQTNGERIVGTVLSSTSFTFALVTADATFSGGLMTYAATLSIDPAIGTKLYDDKVEVIPYNYYAITDAVGDLVRHQTTTGTASGTIAATTSSTFMSTNQFKTVQLDTWVHRNKDDTLDIVTLDTSIQDREAIAYNVKTMAVNPTTSFNVFDRTGVGHGAMIQASSNALTFEIEFIEVTGMSTATVRHTSTSQPRLRAGDAVTIVGMSLASFNLVWTITGTPTPTEFTFSVVEASRVPPQSGNYPGTYAGTVATATATLPVSISTIVVEGANALATVNHAENYLNLLTPLHLTVSQVVVSGGNTGTVTHLAAPEGATSTSLVRPGDLVTLSGFETARSSIESISINSNVATVTHNGGLAGLSTADKITVAGNDGSTNGVHDVASVVDPTHFTFAAPSLLSTKFFSLSEIGSNLHSRF